MDHTKVSRENCGAKFCNDGELNMAEKTLGRHVCLFSFNRTVGAEITALLLYQNNEEM